MRITIDLSMKIKEHHDQGESKTNNSEGWKNMIITYVRTSN